MTGDAPATAAIVAGAASILERDGLLALEVDERRASAVAALIRADGRYTDVVVRSDLAGCERYVVAARGS